MARQLTLRSTAVTLLLIAAAIASAANPQASEVQALPKDGSREVEQPKFTSFDELQDADASPDAGMDDDTDAAADAAEDDDDTDAAADAAEDDDDTDAIADAAEDDDDTDAIADAAEDDDDTDAAEDDDDTDAVADAAEDDDDIDVGADAAEDDDDTDAIADAAEDDDDTDAIADAAEDDDDTDAVADAAEDDDDTDAVADAAEDDDDTDAIADAAEDDDNDLLQRGSVVGSAAADEDAMPKVHRAAHSPWSYVALAGGAIAAVCATGLVVYRRRKRAEQLESIAVPLAEEDHSTIRVSA